jgi:lipopolysaccharide/colanic/teichoic acid biosynthesis glycosyltransferase
VGRVLRSTKLDELPQLFNVVRGDMSLVGPRPEVPRYVEALRDRFEPILRVRPGITGIAAVRFRHEESLLEGVEDPARHYVEVVLPEKLGLEEAYLARRSLRVDLQILLATLTGGRGPDLGEPG